MKTKILNTLFFLLSIPLNNKSITINADLENRFKHHFTEHINQNNTITMQNINNWFTYNNDVVGKTA